MDFTVGALSQIDDAHATGTEQPNQPVGSAMARFGPIDALQDSARRIRDQTGKVATAGRIEAKERLQFGTEFGSNTSFPKKLFTLGRGESDEIVEQKPHFGIHCSMRLERDNY